MCASQKFQTLPLCFSLIRVLVLAQKSYLGQWDRLLELKFKHIRKETLYGETKKKIVSNDFSTSQYLRVAQG